VIRSVWVFLVGTVWLMVYGAHMILATHFGFKNTQCVCDRNPRAWGLKILKAAKCTVRVRGGHHLDPDSPQIVISNHESWFDVFALAGHIPGRYRWVAKKELEKVPVFGRAFVSCGHVTVDRGDRGSAVESLEKAARQINADNSSIMIFPEGTRSPTGALQRFKKGAFVLAIQAGVPIVPVAVRGGRAIMPKGSYRVRPGELEIQIGEPISVEGMTHTDRDRLLQQSFDAMAALRGGTGPTEIGTPSAVDPAT